MKPDSIHYVVKDILDEIVKKYPALRKIKTIKLNDPDSKAVIDYEPDYVIERKVSQNTYYLIVFEVIDGQSDIKTMADLARILGKIEIKKAIFVTGSDKKEEETNRIISALVGAYKARFSKKRKEIINISSPRIKDTDSKMDIQQILLNEISNFLPK